MFRRLPPPPQDSRMVQRPRTTQQQQQQQQQYHTLAGIGNRHHFQEGDYDDEDENKEDPQHASLIQSVTAEEDDDDNDVHDNDIMDDDYSYENNSNNHNNNQLEHLSHGALVQQVRSNSKSNNKSNTNRHRQAAAVAYLLRYETMVRQQEAEDMATMAHLRPCFERILQLLGHDNVDNESMARSTASSSGTGGWCSMAHDYKDNDENADAAFWKQEITFADLQKALTIMETSTSSASSTPEFMTTDRQLLMVLRLLAQKAAHDLPLAEDGSSTSCSSSSGSESTTGDDNNTCTTASDASSDADATVKITWAEVMQCYKVCIAGMHVLQHLPALSSVSSYDNDQSRPAVGAESVVAVHDIIRARARDRTLTMLSLFEPPSTRLFTDGMDHSNGGGGRGRRSSLTRSGRSAQQRGAARRVQDSAIAVWQGTANVCLSKWKQSNKRQRGMAMLILLAILLVVTTFSSNRTAMISNATTHQPQPHSPGVSPHSAPRSRYSTTTTSTSHHQQHQHHQMMKNPIVYNKPPLIVSSKTKPRMSKRSVNAGTNRKFHQSYTQPEDQYPSGSVSTTQCATTATTTAPFTGSLHHPSSAHGLGNAAGSVVDVAVLQPAIIGAVLGAPVIVASVQLAMAGLASGSLFSTLICGAGVVSLISVAFRAAKHWLTRFMNPT